MKDRLWLRLVLMGLAGVALGALLARLPWWAVVAVVTGFVVWAVVMFVQLERDMREARRQLAELAARMNKGEGEL